MKASSSRPMFSQPLVFNFAYSFIPRRKWYTIRSVSSSALASSSLIFFFSSSLVMVGLLFSFPLRIAYHLAGLTFTGASFASSGHPAQNIRNRPASGPSCPGCAFLGSFLISGAWPGGFFSAFWGALLSCLHPIMNGIFNQSPVSFSICQRPSKSHHGPASAFNRFHQ